MNHPLCKDISSLTLRLMAMWFMVCDHLWATVVPGNSWLTWVGRLAFPIFAFLTAEGYRRTGNFRKYLGRMALWAAISELPFNLMYTGSWIFPFHQNVLWSFVLALLCMRAMDALRAKLPPWAAWPLAGLTAAVFALAAQLLMVDYYSYGLLTVLVFYLFPGNSLASRVGQLCGLFYLHWVSMGSMTVPVTLWGMTMQVPQQGMAVLALIPIWSYQGRQGRRSKGLSFLFYAFYPAHMLLLGLLSR